MQRRNLKIDNIKGLSVSMVLAIHFLNPVYDDQPLIRLALLFLNITAVPCLVFISGFLARPERLFKRVLKFLGLYLIYKLLAFFPEYYAFGVFSLKNYFLLETGAPWYLLSLAAWSIMALPFFYIPVSSLLVSTWVLVLIVSCLSGFFRLDEGFLALDRVIGFFPIFLSGVYIRKLGRIPLSGFKLRIRPAFILTGAFAFSLIIFSLSPRFDSTVFCRWYWIYINEGELPLGISLRILWCIICSVIPCLMLYSAPGWKTFFTVTGIKSLQVYILHRPLRDLLMGLGFFSMFSGFAEFVQLLLIPCGFFMAFILGLI